MSKENETTKWGQPVDQDGNCTCPEAPEPHAQHVPAAIVDLPPPPALPDVSGLTLGQVARDVFDAWAATGAAEFFGRTYSGPHSLMGHPMNAYFAIDAACRLIGGWKPSTGYKGVVLEKGGYVIVGADDLIDCPCGGREPMPGYPCPRCGGGGLRNAPRVKPEPKGRR